MKLILSTIICIAVGLLIVTCSKNNNSQNDGLQNTPTAKATYDNSNYGIYKGIFVGSTGYVIININNDNTVSATLKIDGITYNFTSSQTIQLNQPASINFISGANSFTFSVAANGANPAISNLVISGHPAAAIAVLKESSSELVEVFEGTYAENAVGGELGAFNLAIKGNEVVGIAHDSQQLYNYTIAGTVSNNHINAVVSPGGSIVEGTISGADDNNISGTYSATATGGTPGTWSGKRTL
ncbi:MAG TPA: hypothetical protein VHD35_16255 [Chitinophagaceae bacterium]|nr:hypothetical protein [Chitinophagaceae bacterium]